MKIIFRPIFIIFFTLLVLSFAFSMRKSNWQTAQVKENLGLVEAENRRLLLEEQELIYKKELSALPLTKERIIRDQKWLQRENEEILEMPGFVSEEKVLPENELTKVTAWQEWQRLIFGQSE